MDSSRFHDVFVATAIRLTGYYEDKFAALEREINKLKVIIENLTIDVEADIDVGADGGYRSYNVTSNIDAKLELPFIGEIGMDIGIDDLECCDKCAMLYLDGNEHFCETDSDIEAESE